MLSNKDIRVENGFLIINGDKYPLDGQSPETIMEIVEDNSDTTPTENSTAPITSGGVFAADKAISDIIGDITQTGITGASVAAQLTEVDSDVTTIKGQIGDLNFAVISQQFTDVSITRAWGVLFESTQRYGINLASLNLSNPPKAAFLSLGAGTSPVLFEQIVPSASEVPFYFVRPNDNLTAYSATVNCLVIY